jgi:hypothetical protein
LTRVGLTKNATGQVCRNMNISVAGFISRINWYTLANGQVVGFEALSSYGQWMRIGQIDKTKATFH